VVLSAAPELVREHGATRPGDYGPELVGAGPRREAQSTDRARHGHQHPGRRCRRYAVPAEDQQRGRGADAGTDRKLSQRHHRDHHGDRIEERGAQLLARSRFVSVVVYVPSPGFKTTAPTPSSLSALPGVSGADSSLAGSVLSK
jgi:hypothetical protein